MSITIYSSTLTLKDAETFIGINNRNRPILKRVVNQYVEDILAGRWTATGDTIKLNEEGELLDGQHRCLALIRANAKNPAITELPIIIVMGVPNEAQDHMDVGRQRTVTDQLSMRGHSYSAAVAAAARHIVNYQINGGAEPIRHLSHPRLIEWVENNPDILDLALIIGRRQDNTSGIPHSGLIAAFWVLVHAGADPSAVEDFLLNLATGTNLPENSPSLALRNRLLNAQQKHEKISTTIRFVLVLRAWNAYRRGDKPTKIQIRQGNGGTIITPGKLEK